MPVVFEDLDLPGRQAPFAEVRVEVAGIDCQPLSPVYTTLPELGQTIVGAKRLKPGHGINDDGSWQLNLVSNLHINPPGTVYRVERRTSDGDVAVDCISVPATGASHPLSSLVVDPPGSVTSAALALHEADPLAHQPFSALQVNGLATLQKAKIGDLPYAGYQRLTFLAKQMDPFSDQAPTYGDPTLALPYGGWNFPPNLDRSVGWPFASPRVGLEGGADVFWTAFSVALIWFNLGNTLGNVRWRLRVRNLAIFSDLVTEAPAVDVTTTLANAGQNVIAVGFLSLNVPINQGPFGSEYSIVITRMGSEGTDTLEQSVRLGMCSFNQTA